MVNFSKLVTFTNFSSNGVSVANAPVINGNAVSSHAFNLFEDADSDTDYITFGIKTSDNNIRQYKATYNTSTGKWSLSSMPI